MSDIELVIKIPKEQYSLIMQSHRNDVERFIDKEAMMYAIKNGTPFPKGHGGLIDKDALGEKLHRYTEAPYQYALTVFNESPIIIDADKE